MRELKLNHLYRHFKGGLYITIDVAKDSETGEDLVIYRNLHNMILWARPVSQFLSEVDKEKYPDVFQNNRFEEVELDVHIEKKEEGED